MQEATDLHCALAFKTLIDSFKTNGITQFQSDVDFGEGGLFVTWKKKGRDGTYGLRGCIGCFNTLPLKEGIVQYAIVAGKEDPRFPPMKEREVADLQLNVPTGGDARARMEHRRYAQGTA
ncbi:hypothetical protein PCE1_004602 [Barthelona sp. PCE]